MESMGAAVDTCATRERKASPALRVLAIGNTYVDELVELPRFPVPDEKLSVKSVEEVPGGSATNACCALRSYGVDAHLHSVRVLRIDLMLKCNQLFI